MSYMQSIGIGVVHGLDVEKERKLKPRQISSEGLTREILHQRKFHAIRNFNPMVQAPRNY
jgi:hypothetical protein